MLPTNPVLSMAAFEGPVAAKDTNKCSCVCGPS